MDPISGISVDALLPTSVLAMVTSAWLLSTAESRGRTPLRARVVLVRTPRQTRVFTGATDERGEQAARHDLIFCTSAHPGRPRLRLRRAESPCGFTDQGGNLPDEVIGYSSECSPAPTRCAAASRWYRAFDATSHRTSGGRAGG